MSAMEVLELSGRVMLPGGAEHDCSVRFANDEELELVLSAAVPSGSFVICHVPDLGVVEGIAGVATVSGCRLAVRATPVHRARLATRMAWHRRRAAGDGEQRTAERVVPKSAAVRLVWPDGRAVEATVIDFSATGAALRSHDRPEPGAPVVVGRRRAIVVRHLSDGFAVRFALPLRLQDVTVDTIL